MSAMGPPATAAAAAQAIHDDAESAASVARAILGARRVTAICHENPDADTLGAALAIHLIATRLGKEAETVCVDPPPRALGFLPGVESVRQMPRLEPDLTVVLDSGDIGRVGSSAPAWEPWLEPSRIVNIDHHVSNPGYGAVNLVDPRAAATCEIITLLLPALGVPLDLELATLLLTGIVQDTHCFAHPNATPRTLRVAADLVAAGAPLSAINRAIYLDRPFTALALWGRMLASIGQRLDGRIVYASLTGEMLTETGADPTDAEGFVDLLASTRSGDVTVLFKGLEEGATRASVRTTERADAVAITGVFGGGGHARAAGCTVPEPIERAREALLVECEREIARQDAGSR